MILLERVTKAFDRPVLRDVSMHVPIGGAYGLIGPPAGGKTVLLKVIAGLSGFDAGRVRVSGAELGSMDDIELMQFRLGVGMQFQNHALFDHLTVAENVAFPLRRQGVPADEAEARAAEELRLVGLEQHAGKLPTQLSGGQRRRVGIARAIVHRPALVLCDEPAAGLDPVTSQRIFDLLRRVQSLTGATVLIVSSDLDRLLSSVDRVGMLLDGRLTFEGTLEQARSSDDPALHQFLRGEPDGPL